MVARGRRGGGARGSLEKMDDTSTGRLRGGWERVRLEVDADGPDGAMSSSSRGGAAERRTAGAGAASSADDEVASTGSLKATRHFFREPPSIASSLVFIVAIIVVIPLKASWIEDSSWPELSLSYVAVRVLFLSVLPFLEERAVLLPFCGMI